MAQINQNLNQTAAQNQSLFKRAQEMSQGKNTAELEQIARNICASKGISFEDALQQFKQIWGK